ncbi:UNVERIFIED_CONTAM: hypothetical protein GTU68_040916 [Idotea baltica]|nr:hypothetical protein [Idotea baltica]
MASSPYIHYVVEELDKRGMPLELALLPVIESSYNPKAYSRSKAVGLWQFMSATGQDFDLDQTRWYDGRKDVVASTDAAINYLSYLHTMFNDDWLLALAAYNAGEGRVSNAIEHNHRLGLPTDYWDLPLPTETKNYVPKLLAVSEIIKNNQMYGIHLASIADKPYFVMIPTKQQLNLKTVAKTTSTTSDELMKLNPGYKHSIMKDGPSRLLVPVQKAKSVQASLAAMPSSSYASSASTYTSNSTYRPTTYTVHKGDTVHSISQRYNININDLKLLNHIASNNVISLGQTIKIPAQPSQGSQLSYRDKKRQAYALKKRQELAMYSNKSNTAQHSSIVYYKVKQGDSIPAIADRLNISMNDLRVINPQKYSALTPGQTLKLRVPE